MIRTIQELELICQKPHWRERGSLLARRFARPAALYVTWLVRSWSISANAVTGCTLLVGLTAAVFMAVPSCFPIGVGALWLWYLLDHVDGQIARLHKSQSVTGIYFDFMMHHLVHPSVAFALGYGLASLTGCLPWALAGASFALGTTALSLTNDCRYKALFAALSAEGAVACRPTARSWCERNPAETVGELQTNDPALHGLDVPNSAGHRIVGLLKLLRTIYAILVRSCEIPNIILALTLFALFEQVTFTESFVGLRVYIVIMSVVAPSLAFLRLFKQVWHRLPDREAIGIPIPQARPGDR